MGQDPKGFFSAHASYAVVLDIWKPEPIWHVPGWDGKPLFQAQEITRCGRKIGSYKPWLPRKHVAKFARPCKTCFPGRES